MANNSPELVSKKKAIVNKESFFSAPRTSTDEAELDGSVYEDTGDLRFFNSNESDKVRVVLGKNWDFKAGETGTSFKASWAEPKLLGPEHDNSITLKTCGDPIFLSDGSSKSWETVVLEISSPITDGLENHIYDWAAYTKLGLVTPAGSTYQPVVVSEKPFYDYYHEAILPFEASDLINQEPAGKAFFANFKTYYNERIDSSKYENIIANNSEASHMHNALPSIYGFLRLSQNKKTVESELFDLSNLNNELLRYIKGHPAPEEAKKIYTEALKEHPLEALITLFGSVGNQTLVPFDDVDFTEKEKFLQTKIIEKIVSLNFNIFDADGLFSSYLKEYVELLTGWLKWRFLGSPKNTDTTAGRSPVTALERIMTNLVFSADSLKLLNKVDQYKKHFPFYIELEFTANLLTPLGDSMKQFLLTKPMSEAILSNFNPYGGDFTNSWTQGTFTQNEVPITIPGESFFIEYTEDKIYKTLNGLVVNDQQTGSGVVELTEGTISQPISKKYQDFKMMFDLWANSNDAWCNNGMCEGIYYGGHAEADEFDNEDLRNYITYFRNDNSEPININSDDNVIFKKLFGAAFNAKLVSLYNDHRRTWQDIIAGKPAYTEDLFYRIVKSKKRAEEGATWEQIQNILIPNTSELDIVKYVDTQIKYSDSSTYKYDVFVHRVVFGSSYTYRWLNSSNTVSNSGYTYAAFMNMDAIKSSIPLTEAEYQADGHMAGLSECVESGADDVFSYSAKFRVDVAPSIVILEDKLFSTPEMFIMDKPPVIPDVDIIPYRAINNRIKILLTGASDRYKAVPIVMLEGDQTDFDKIKKAQLVIDGAGNPLPGGKVEFGSDDPVGNFQIFRTQQKPQTYADFKLYKPTTGVFEEQILPNTKYYYTFRAIDDHGHFSNPTPVYEVELIDEKGAVKPIIRLVDMEPKNNKTNVKDCQRYIYLKPTPKQIYFSDDPEVDGIFSTSEKLKKYKMRLTSKGSGKKIDINFSFKKELQNEID